LSASLCPSPIANRLLKGDSFTKLTIHALWRSLILILLGVFLRSTHATQTNWTFEDTLTQIGLGYFFLFLLGWTKPSVAWIVFVLILVGYWTAWVMYPSAGPDFISHWAKNQNLGSAFDTWFLNLFPRKAPFTANGGGYLTLSFIPTLATMILGLIAGWWLQDYVTKAAEGEAPAEPQTSPTYQFPDTITYQAHHRRPHRLSKWIRSQRVQHLSQRQTYLDTHLGSLQRGLVLPAPRLLRCCRSMVPNSAGLSSCSWSSASTRLPSTACRI
jgi:hypothetical protein